MIRPLVSATALTLSCALPLSALDLESMSDAERDAFREEVRAYLLENPEVIMEAVSVPEQREAEAQAQNDQDLVAANADALFNDESSGSAAIPRATSRWSSSSTTVAAIANAPTPRSPTFWRKTATFASF